MKEVALKYKEIGLLEPKRSKSSKDIRKLLERHQIEGISSPAVERGFGDIGDEGEDREAAAPSRVILWRRPLRLIIYLLLSSLFYAFAYFLRFVTAFLLAIRPSCF